MYTYTLSVNFGDSHLEAYRSLGDTSSRGMERSRLKGSPVSVPGCWEIKGYRKFSSGSPDIFPDVCFPVSHHFPRFVFFWELFLPRCRQEFRSMGIKNICYSMITNPWSPSWTTEDSLRTTAEDSTDLDV